MKFIHKRSLTALISAFLVTVSILPITVFAAESTDYRLGDVNSDGVVNSLDSMLVLQGGLSGTKNLAADVNQDALVNGTDADLILEYRVGKSTVFKKASVLLNVGSLSFTSIGETATITSTVQNGSGEMTTNLKWTIADSDIASISNGVVTAKKAGTTNLTVTLLNGEKIVCPIIVSDEKKQYWGIDVSTHQKNINWTQVKKSDLYNYTWEENGQNRKLGKLSDTIDFAIIRDGYGRFIDPDGSSNLAEQTDAQYYNNYRGAKSVGMPLGTYHYSYANTPEDARNEARLCLNIIQGHSFEYPVFFDAEDSEMLTKPDGSRNSRSEMNAIITAFCEEIRKAGYYPAVYTGKRLAVENLDTSKLNYDLWIAQYNGSGYDPKGSSFEQEGHGKNAMWQYNSQTQGVTGISTGGIDANISYVNYPKIIKASGLNKAQTDQSKSAIISGTAGLLFGSGLLK